MNDATTRTVSASTLLACVIGDPIRHSLSPTLHNAAFDALGLDWIYLAFEVPAGRGIAAIEGMRALGIRGASITMPHKEDAATACDDVTADASALRSVNSIMLGDDGRLHGDSTDGEGFLRSLREADVDVAGRSVLVVGGGGAARAVGVALARAAAVVAVSARRSEAAAALAALAPGTTVVEWDRRDEAVSAADIVVNTTPLGMLGDTTLAIDPRSIRSGQVVADLVYRPLATPLLAAARAAGAGTVDGLGMLVHQAALAFEQWTGVAPPVGVMRAAAESAMRVESSTP